MTYPPGQQAIPTGIKRPADVNKTEHLDAVARLGLQWLESQKDNNVVTESEFSRFIPLFRKADIEKMTPEAIHKLSFEYSQRFSPHEPVIIIDEHTPDENGHICKRLEDGVKYKVIATIPARLNRLESVNVLGERVVQVAAECMANTRSTNNPFENKGEYYSQAMAHLVGLANRKGISEQSAEFKKYEATLLNKGDENKEPSGTPSSPENKSNPSGIDADWDE